MNKNKSYNDILPFRNYSKNNQFINHNKKRFSETHYLKSKLTPIRKTTVPVNINNRYESQRNSSKQNIQKNFNEILPKSIKHVQSKRNIDKFTESESQTNNLAIDNEGLEDEEYIKVIRVLVDGNEIPLEEIKNDNKINNYLKSNGYDSFEENGKRVLKRRSISRSVRTDSVNLP